MIATFEIDLFSWKLLGKKVSTVGLNGMGGVRAIWFVLTVMLSVFPVEGMNKEYRFEGGCNESNCPTMYNVKGRENDRYAMCMDDVVCRCEAPFAGPNCENWFEEDADLRFWGHVLVYFLEAPIMLKLFVVPHYIRLFYFFSLIAVSVMKTVA